MIQVLFFFIYLFYFWSAPCCCWLHPASTSRQFSPTKIHWPSIQLLSIASTHETLFIISQRDLNSFYLLLFVTLFNNSIYLTKTETFLVTYSIFLSYYYYFFFWSFWRSETSLSLSFFSLQGNLSYKDCVRRWKVRSRVLTGHHQATFVCWQNLYTYIFLFDIFPTSVSFIETAISLLSLKRVTLRVGNSGDNIATRSRLKKNRNEKKRRPQTWLSVRIQRNSLYWQIKLVKKKSLMEKNFISIETNTIRLIFSPFCFLYWNWKMKSRSGKKRCRAIIFTSWRRHIISTREKERERRWFESSCSRPM